MMASIAAIAHTPVTGNDSADFLLGAAIGVVLVLMFHWPRK